MIGIWNESLSVAVGPQIHAFQNELSDQDLVAKNQGGIDSIAVHNDKTYGLRHVNGFRSPVSIGSNPLAHNFKAKLLHECGRQTSATSAGINES
jgi:hypothetical protein